VTASDSPHRTHRYRIVAVLAVGIALAGFISTEVAIGQPFHMAGPSTGNAPNPPPGANWTSAPPSNCTDCGEPFLAAAA